MFLWNIAVTSLVEVWIEIPSITVRTPLHFVTSLVEVWIEIHSTYTVAKTHLSLPLWKCGLKSVSNDTIIELKKVTSLVEVWIEI